MNTQIFCDILFEQKGDILINGIDFHKRILKQYEYFNKLFAFNLDNKKINLINSSGILFSSTCLKKFKQYLYKQSFYWNYIEIDTYFEYINFSKMFELHLDSYDKLYDENIQNEIKKYNEFHKLEFEYNPEFNDKIHRIYMCVNALIISDNIYLNRTLSNISIINLLELNDTHPESIHLLAFCHEIGLQTKKDIAKAHKLYEKNYTQNKYEKSFASMNRLSDSEVKSEFKHILKDKMKNFKLIIKEKMSERSKKIMIYYSALAFENGLIINNEVILPQNQQLACKIMLNNFELHDCKFSLNNYAYYCQYGIGTEIDTEKALNLYKLCYEKYNYSTSLKNMAVCHILSDIEEERKIGFEYYNKYHKKNSCYFELGLCYQMGCGVNKDEKKAIELYETGYQYDSEDKNCLYALAEIYQKTDIKKSQQL
jgi:TPR repeat protein